MEQPTKVYHRKTYPSIDPTRPELSAAGKTILITGGGTGIGAETAKYFAKAGASRIGILGRRIQPLVDTKKEIEGEHQDVEIVAIATDVTNNDAVSAAFEKIASGGKIHVLVSNAAVIGKIGKIAEMTTKEFMAGVITNLEANVNLTLSFLKYAAEDPVIIETNSAAAYLNITGGFASYNVAKMATARFYSSLTLEHPEIRIYSVQPGTVDTDMSREAGYKPKEEGEEWQWEGETSAALGQRDEANLPASFYVWLASPEARFLNGKYLWANWDVDELKAKAKEIEGSALLSIALMT